MSDAVWTAKQALRRHGDYARIAAGLVGTDKLLPGGRSRKMTPEEGIEQVQGALTLWYDVSHSKEWNDPWALQLWNRHIANLPNYREPAQIDEEASGPQRRKLRDQLRVSLKPIAEGLTDKARAEMAAQWKAGWVKNDAAWQPRQKWLRRWLLPRKLGPPRDRMESTLPRIARSGSHGMVAVGKREM